MFLDCFIQCASLTEAARACSIDRGEHYQWLKNDPAYAAEYEIAKPQAAQSLHDSAVQRALVGVYEPIVYQGQFQYPVEQYEIAPATENEPAVTGVRNVPGAPPLGVWKRSERLHEILLRAHIPEFRQSNVEISGKDGGPVQNSLTIEFVKPTA
jgi:hypothetical protein